jgi:putative PIN family toxin of toxin-antitoxin system
MFVLPRLTLDTNILVSSLITEGTPPDLLYRAWKEERFFLVTSKEQLAELTRVFAYPKLRPYVKPIEAKELLAGLEAHAIVVGDLPIVHYSPDPADNLILATAIKGQAIFLVTGDKKDLLSLKKIDGVSIITARAALEILDTTPFGSEQ